MTKHSTDSADVVVEDSESSENRSWGRKAVLIVALFCLASCLIGFFFLVTRLIVPSGFF